MTTLREAIDSLQRQVAERIADDALTPCTLSFERAQAVLAALAQQAEPFSPDAIRTTQTAWKMGYDAAKAEMQQAEPVEPVAYRHLHEDGWEYHDAPTGEDCAECQALYAAPPQRKPVEPVAWMYTGIKQDGTEHGPHLVWKPEYMDAMSASKGAKATPLYFAPPQRKPLTDEEIERLWYPSAVMAEPGKRRVAFGRAVERKVRGEEK